MISLKQLKSFLSEEEAAKKGLHVFDVDGVVFHPNAHVHVNDENGNRVESLNHHEFNTHKLKPGHSYDFSEFRHAETFDKGSPIHRIVHKIRKIQGNGGHVVFNTARADFDNKDKVIKKFEKHGIDMSKSHLYRAGNEDPKQSTAEKKNIVLRRILNKGQHSHVHFHDDDIANLKAFNRMSKEYPNIKFHAWHVHPDGYIKKFKDE